ncbi:MAG: family 43 glycosylhydrolase, partial [Peristeroidobacter soli]
MKHVVTCLLAAAVAGLFQANVAFATNPLITDQFTADPTARVFEGRVYVYPSHDINEPPGYKGRPKWFVMEDYHVFSSDNPTDWKDHGVILTRDDVPWADPTAYAMWAPDAVFKDGKYYFYFPATAKGGGRRIGVAIADKPSGPFKPEATPIEGVQGIDPGVLLDKDGSAYLFWSATDKLFAAKLKPNMLEIEGEPITFDNLPKKGLQEGPFVFERGGTYYLTYPHKENKIERLEYATGASPLGPYKWAGVLADESVSGCWTNHQSIVEYQGQWYLFYHDQDLSPGFDKHRSIRADKLFFNA